MRRCSILLRALQRVDPLSVEFLAEHITRAPSNRPFSNDVVFSNETMTVVKYANPLTQRIYVSDHRCDP